MAQATMPAAPANERLFFAAVPDPATRERLVVLAAELGRNYRARWVRPARYHLTLCFLGAHARTPSSLIDMAMQAAAQVRLSALVWRPDHVSSFHAARPPCVLRERTAHTGVQRLHHALRDALAGCGVQVPDRQRFTPHLTLGYGHATAIVETRVPPLDVAVREFVLLYSVPSVADYRILGRWPLDEA